MTSSAPPADARRPEQFVAALCQWLTELGAEPYDDDVSQLAHALQCAALATADSAAPPTVAAALLHDVGHLFATRQRDTGAYRQRDLHHERAGANWLARYFGPAVTEPVRLHVAAKRYLCATEDGYWAGLSAGSKRSLALQGGAMDPAEVSSFQTLPGHAGAVRVRRWDDRAKVVSLTVPALQSYRGMLCDLITAHGAARGPGRSDGAVGRPRPGPIR